MVGPSEAQGYTTKPHPGVRAPHVGADGLDSGLGNPEGSLEEAARARQVFHIH